MGIRKRSFGTIVANGFDLAEDITGFDLIYAILMTSEGRTESKDKVLKHFDKLIAENLQAQTAKTGGGSMVAVRELTTRLVLENLGVIAQVKSFKKDVTDLSGDHGNCWCQS